MIIEKTFQGAWKISALVEGHLITRQYFYYTKKEAIKAFREETANE